MRHGADPDHLAAIDNVTRNAHAAGRPHSRLAGLFFAGGHSAMVIAIAVTLALLSSRLAVRAQWLELLGGWLSVTILLLMAAANIRALLNKRAGVAGVKARLLPRVLREAQSPIAAAAIGMLFGLGFETSSQIGAYGAALSEANGAIGAIVVACAFCAGMIVTDTFDSLLVHRIVGDRMGNLPHVVRFWLAAVTVLSLGVGAYEIAGLLGLHVSAETDLIAGLVMTGIFVLMFAGVYAFAARRRKDPRGMVQT